MNGEFGELYTKLREDIVRLETRQAERWDSHDKRSLDNWNYIRTKLEKLDSLPCEKEKTIIGIIKGQLVAVWALMVVIVAIIAKIISQ